MLTLIVFIIILSILVLIHEAGHFFVAKFFGIKVEEFGFGFPPKMVGIKRGETEYTINWLPFGGFVKMYGEDEAGMGKIGSTAVSGLSGKDLKRAFFARPAWQKALVIFAGVVMNVILAFIVFYAFLALSNFKTVLPLLTDHQFTNTHQTNYNLSDNSVVISSLEPDSPAERAHIDTPTQVITVDGKPVGTIQHFVKYVNSHKGQPITMTMKNIETGNMQTKTITPRVHPPKGGGAMGVAFVPMALLSYDTPTQKIFSGITYSYDLMAYTFDVMGKLISNATKTHNYAPVGESVSGPVGIFSVIGDILKIPSTKQVVLSLLNLTGALSISLAFFNVLPIPALDGGRLFFILIELVTGRKVNPRIEAMIHAVGMALLLSLLVLITVMDISKLLH